MSGKRPTTCLFVAERFAPDLGGVSRSATRTAKAIAQLGVDVHVLAWTKQQQAGVLRTEPLLDSVGSAHVTAHRLGLFSNWDLSMQHSTNVLEWLHQQIGFEMVWGHYVYPAGFLAVMFAEGLRLPSVVSARGNDIDRLMFPPGDFARLEWTLSRASEVTAVSEDLGKKIDVLLGEPRATVLHNVVNAELFHGTHDTEESAKLRTQFGIEPDESVLGFCGELRHKKGLPFLLAALRQVRQQRPACLFVMGEVRPREQAQLSAFAAEHPEDARRIVVSGHIEESATVAAWLRLCDVVLLPSVWDGLPNALLEAMACERVVIASDAGGMPEVVQHDQTGFLVPKAQLDKLGLAILEVLDLPAARRQEIGAAARRQVVEHFNADEEQRRIGALLDRL